MALKGDIYKGKEDDKLNDVYYKIYHWDKIDKLTVVCMQWFDEFDYHQDRFFTDEDGTVLQFDDESEALDWLNNNIKPEMIDPECRKIKHKRSEFLL